MSVCFDLSGKTALVTGASSGLGAQMARGLAEQGAVRRGRRTERRSDLLCFGCLYLYDRADTLC